jgi:hypothetical protein
MADEEVGEAGEERASYNSLPLPFFPSLPTGIGGYSSLDDDAPPRDPREVERRERAATRIACRWRVFIAVRRMQLRLLDACRPEAFGLKADNEQAAWVNGTQHASCRCWGRKAACVGAGLLAGGALVAAAPAAVAWAASVSAAGPLSGGLLAGMQASAAAGAAGGGIAAGSLAAGMQSLAMGGVSALGVVKGTALGGGFGLAWCGSSCAACQDAKARDAEAAVVQAPPPRDRRSSGKPTTAQPKV